MQMGEEGVPEGEAQRLPDGFPYSGPGGLEAAAMRAFAAALGQRPRGLEPVTDFWSAGGDSLAAAQVGEVAYLMCAVLRLPFLSWRSHALKCLTYVFSSDAIRTYPLQRCLVASPACMCFAFFLKCCTAQLFCWSHPP